jgi:hypothetical protein
MGLPATVVVTGCVSVYQTHISLDRFSRIPDQTYNCDSGEFGGRDRGGGGPDGCEGALRCGCAGSGVGSRGEGQRRERCCGLDNFLGRGLWRLVAVALLSRKRSPIRGRLLRRRLLGGSLLGRGLLRRRLLGRGLFGGRLLGRSLLGRSLLGRGLLGRRLLGRGLLGGRLLGRGLLGGGLLRGSLLRGSLLRGSLLRRNTDTGDLERSIRLALALGWRWSDSRRWWSAASANGDRDSGRGHRDIVKGDGLGRLALLEIVEDTKVAFLQVV